MSSRPADASAVVALAMTKSSFVVSSAVLTTAAARATHTPPRSCMLASLHSTHEAAPSQRAQPVAHATHSPVAAEVNSPTRQRGMHVPGAPAAGAKKPATAHEVHAAASAGASHVAHEASHRAHTRPDDAAVSSAKPAGHAATHAPAAGCAIGVDEAAAQLEQAAGPGPVHSPQLASQASQVPAAVAYSPAAHAAAQRPPTRRGKIQGSAMQRRQVSGAVASQRSQPYCGHAAHWPLGSS